MATTPNSILEASLARESTRCGQGLWPEASGENLLRAFYLAPGFTSKPQAPGFLHCITGLFVVTWHSVCVRARTQHHMAIFL